MEHGHILGRGARVFGSVVCAALALGTLVWIGRDLTVAAEFSDLWWSWSGAPARTEDGIWATSLYDPALIAVYIVAGTTALRSPSAAGSLASAAIATILLRAPGLWTLNADWLQGVDQDLRNRALLSSGAAVTLATVLLIAVAAGRRPADTSGSAYGVVTSDERPPGRPTPAAATTAGVFLAGATVILAAWEVRYAVRDGWDAYWHKVTGERTMYALLQPPDACGKWTVALMCAVVVCCAMARAPLTRTLGMTASALVLVWGAAETTRNLKERVFENFDTLTTEEQLHVSTGLFLLLAGFAALWALAGRGESDPTSEPLRGWQEPSAPPPSW
ncbi:hypothetical protein [Streptomyces boninensis]|uniref:hypothetical protein n=1 Tax=Streptomyces boninensis TaxID=2039455 RepID=UPI003B22402C